MSTQLPYKLEKIKMPRWALELAMKSVATNKLFSAYFSLKAMFPNGVIMNYAAKVGRISQARCEHPKSTSRRINELLDAGMVYHDEEHPEHLHIQSLKDFAAKHGEEYKAQYHFIKTTDKVKFEYVVRTTFLKIKYKEQQVAIIQRIKGQYKVDTQEAERLAGKLLSSRLRAFRDNEVRDFYYNTDCSISQAKIADYFGNESQSSGTYWTKRLEKLKLLTVENRTQHSPKYCKNKDFGFWMYAPGGKGTVLVMPNKLHFTF